MRRAKQKQMEALVASYQSSGLTQREFCVQEDIKLPTFSYWYRKVCTNSHNPTPEFTEVNVPVHTAGLEVVSPNGVIIWGIQDLAVIHHVIKK